MTEKKRKRYGLKELLEEHGRLKASPPAAAVGFVDTTAIAMGGAQPPAPPPERGTGSASRVGGKVALSAAYARAILEAQIRARRQAMALRNPKPPAPQPRPQLVGIIGRPLFIQIE